MHFMHTTRTAHQTDTKLQSLNYPWTGMTFFFTCGYLGKKMATFPKRSLSTWLESKKKEKKKEKKPKQNKTKRRLQTHTNPAQVKQVEERRCESLPVDSSSCGSSNHQSAHRSAALANTQALFCTFAMYCFFYFFIIIP